MDKIKKQKSVHKKRWSNDEEKLLKEMYSDYTMKIPDIAKVLNRSKAGIMGKARKLGLIKTMTRDVKVDNGFKMCSRCFNIKPLNDFYKNRNKKLGLESHCKCCSADLRNNHLIKKAEKKVLQEKKEIEDFINENKNLLFKCGSCRNHLKISEFSVYKPKQGKVKRSNLCKKCNTENTKKKHYRMYAENGYR